MKARMVQVEVLHETDLDTLTTAINEWLLSTQPNADVQVPIHVRGDGTTYWATIVYVKP